MRIFNKASIAGIAFCLLLIVSPAFGQLFMMENPLVGKSAPDFTLTTINKGKQNLRKIRGKKRAILFFWATWCPHCQNVLKKFDENQTTFEKKGIKIVLINLGEGEQQVKKYMSKHNIGLNVFLDLDNSLAQKYSIIALPTVIFIDQKGIIQAVKHSLPENFEDILPAHPPKHSIVHKP